MAKSDTCFQRILKEINEVATTPLATQQEQSIAWKKVVDAYELWIPLAMSRKSREAKIVTLEAELNERLVRLQQTATFSRIHRVRLKMGKQFSRMAIKAEMTPKKESPPEILVRP